MRNILAIIATVIVLAVTTASDAFADSGQYTASSGESCSWFGSGGLYDVSCSGYNRAAGGFVSYTCSVQVYGSTMSYSCMDINGAHWSGSR